MSGLPQGFHYVDEMEEALDTAECVELVEFDAEAPAWAPAERLVVDEDAGDWQPGDHLVVGDAEAAGLAQGFYARFDLPDVKAPEIADGDNEKAVEERLAWEARVFTAQRSSVVSLSLEDEERGLLPDPAWVRSDARLAKDRAANDRLYARLKAGRQPWMDKRTYAAFKARERREALRRRQRSAIVGLLEKLGRDPRSEAVATWVRDQGYDAALWKLHAAAQRAGVVA